MYLAKSSAKDVKEANKMVDRLIKDVKQILKQGKRVMLLWDADFVLLSGRSHDMFLLCKHDVHVYRAYEARLLFEPLEEGVWARALRAFVGLDGVRQYIVTARASDAAWRLLSWIHSNDLKIEDTVCLGSQPKGPSYDFFIRHSCRDQDHVFIIDDSLAHVQDGQRVAERHGLGERAHVIQAPQIRLYDQDELQHELDQVLAPFSAEHTCSARIMRNGQETQIIIEPDPNMRIREMFERERAEAQERAKPRR